MSHQPSDKPRTLYQQVRDTRRASPYPLYIPQHMVRLNRSDSEVTKLSNDPRDWALSYSMNLGLHLHYQPRSRFQRVLDFFGDMFA